MFTTNEVIAYRVISVQYIENTGRELSSPLFTTNVWLKFENLDENKGGQNIIKTRPNRYSRYIIIKSKYKTIFNFSLFFFLVHAKPISSCFTHFGWECVFDVWAPCSHKLTSPASTDIDAVLLPGSHSGSKYYAIISYKTLIWRPRIPLFMTNIFSVFKQKYNHFRKVLTSLLYKKRILDFITLYEEKEFLIIF